MDNPVNAAYGRYDKPPEHEKPLVVLGYTVPAQYRLPLFVVAGLFILFVLWSVFLTLPSGFPFLAAKFAGGFFSYIGLFFLYMIGFFALLLLIAAGVVVGFRIYEKAKAKAKTA
jgi:di/tricarboxylate transporter